MTTFLCHFPHSNTQYYIAAGKAHSLSSYFDPWPNPHQINLMTGWNPKFQLGVFLHCFVPFLYFLFLSFFLFSVCLLPKQWKQETRHWATLLPSGFFSIASLLILSTLVSNDIWIPISTPGVKENLYNKGMCDGSKLPALREEWNSGNNDQKHLYYIIFFKNSYFIPFTFSV